MIIDGKHIAEKVYEKLTRFVATLSHPPRVDIIIVGENPVIESFIRIKQRAAQRLGVQMVEHRFAAAITEAALIEEIKKIAILSGSHGLIVQLPLPLHFNTQTVLDMIPVTRDVDMLSTNAMALFACEKAKIIPPVAGAVKEILDHANVKVFGEEVLILGFGRLVGKPVSILMRHNLAHVTVVDKPIPDLALHVKESLVVISGVGTQNLITRDMVNERHVLIDAGTSESEGKVVGDIDPRAGAVARVFTPVPGGVGPITVAMLFQNLCVLARSEVNKE